MKVKKTFEKIDLFLFRISMLAVFIMMLLTAADVIIRRLFHSPLIGVYEFTEYYLMIVTVFLSMSYVMKMKGHVSLDLLVRKFPPKWSMYLNLLNYTLMTIFLIFVMYMGLELTLDALKTGKVGTGLVAWPFWLSYIFVPIGTLFFVLRLFINIFTTISNLIKRNYNYTEVDSEA